MINARLLTKPPGRKLQKPSALAHPAGKYRLPLFLTLLHLPLGLVLYNSTALTVVLPAAIFLFGLYWALNTKETLEKVGWVVAYIIGVEVLLRMSYAPIFWEFGKYSAAIIMITALVRRAHYKIPALPFLYFAFLLPACILTISENGIDVAKDKLSFNMSGPLLLAASCWFFSYLKVTPSQLKTLILTIVVPLTSVAVTTLFYTVSNTEIQFTTESNFATSGGFGPNQVSSMLGLGVFLCVACYLIFVNDLTAKLYLGLFALLFTAQSVMTFSRGGIYGAVGAILVVIFFQMGDPKKGLKRLAPVLGISAVFLILIFPILNNFTDGNLLTRFEESGGTNRAEIIESDFEMFWENPVFGVGVGESEEYRQKNLERSYTTHTEFSRVISEHGGFGILALITLLVMTGYNIKRQKSWMGKALAGGALAWSVLYMLNAGMRLAAPSFIWGLSFLTITSFPNVARRLLVRRDVRNG